MSQAARRPPNLVVATSLLIVTEVMFFAGLISAYLVARARAGDWPPVGQPRLPMAATGLNTAVLLLSAYTMWLALSRERREWLVRTAMLGLAFVLLQGREWARLLAFGLTVRSGVYGSFFYIIVGAHALHVMAGLALLGLMYHYHSAIATRAGALFWWFVVGLWPLLYLLVYVL